MGEEGRMSDENCGVGGTALVPARPQPPSTGDASKEFDFRPLTPPTSPEQSGKAEDVSVSNMVGGWGGLKRGRQGTRRDRTHNKENQYAFKPIPRASP
jgi:hypothetical protein